MGVPAGGEASFVAADDEEGVEFGEQFWPLREGVAGLAAEGHSGGELVGGEPTGGEGASGGDGDLPRLMGMTASMRRVGVAESPPRMSAVM